MGVSSTAAVAYDANQSAESCRRGSKVGGDAGHDGNGADDNNDDSA